MVLVRMRETSGGGIGALWRERLVGFRGTVCCRSSPTGLLYWRPLNSRFTLLYCINSMAWRRNGLYPVLEPKQWRHIVSCNDSTLTSLMRLSGDYVAPLSLAEHLEPSNTPMNNHVARL